MQIPSWAREKARSSRFLRQAWADWRRLKRTIAWLRKRATTPRIDFRCNICGKPNSFPRAELKREVESCRHCGSTLRWRSIIHALSMELFGKSLALPDFPHRPDLAGVGLSDWEGYARPLSEKLNYVNTFYHQEPRLDITSPKPEQIGQYDFLITSDVFEHICPPVSIAFENARRLLKPGGVTILTVPFIEGQTHEHFPEVRKFSIQKEEGEWVLTGTTAKGEPVRHTNLTFHGGPGVVLEFRVFGKEGIKQECSAAAFDAVRIYAEPVEEFGIIWNTGPTGDASDPSSIGTLNAPPWAASRSLAAGDSQPNKLHAT
jgi:ribosomal protein S14